MLCFVVTQSKVADETGVKGGQEKENLSVSKRNGPIDDPQVTKSRLRSLRPAASASTSALSERKNDSEYDTDADFPVPSAPRVPQTEFPALEPALDLSLPPSFKSDSRDSPTPPPNSPRSVSPEIAPHRGASLSPPRPVIPISPYNPLTTPSFRHSPQRLPSDQPWRFPSPSHPLHFTALDASLGMVMREHASPSGGASAPSAIDVSPVIIAPRDGKSSSFNTPGVLIFGKKGVGRSTTKPTPRRLFPSGSLPTPITDRLSLDRARPVEESPLRRIGGRYTPHAFKAAAFAPSRTKMSGTLIASPCTFSEDPFGNLYGPMTETGKPSSVLTVATPLSSPNADSPVIRARRYMNDDKLVKSTLNRELFSKEQSIGLGLLEAFSLNQETTDGDDDCEIDLMLMSSPVLRARSAASDPEPNQNDRDGDGLDSPGPRPPFRKRRKTNRGDVV